MQLTERLKKEKQYADLAARSEELLREDLGTDVTAVWDLVPDGSNGPTLVLRVNDRSEGQSSAAFRLEELEFPFRTHSRLRELKETLETVGVWRKRLRAFFDAVRGWCKDLAPEWELREQPITIREPRAGEYETTVLEISHEGKRAVLRPIAVYSPGTEGLVRIIGAEEDHPLIYSSREGGWNWSDRRKPELHPLTGEQLVKLIRDCMS
jgi:hypothetical protein